MVKIKLEISNLDESVEKSLSVQEIKPEESKIELKKKLRSLVKTESNLTEDNSEDSEKEEEIHEKQPNRKWKYVATATFVLLASFLASKMTISSCGFWATYESNFNKIVYGDELWCFRPLEATVMVERLNEHIVGQHDAIKLIGASLDLANREKIIQIALFGSTGVGKTLTTNIIMQHWKWKPTISLIYDINFQTQLSGQEAFDSDLEVVTSRLQDCGFNLVVIDDLKASALDRIEKLERNLHRIAKQNLFKIVLIAIFNEDSALQDRPLNFVTIEYQTFTAEFFLECIKAHEKLYKVELKPREIEELKAINFTNSGCKTIAKKLNLMSKI